MARVSGAASSSLLRLGKAFWALLAALTVGLGLGSGALILRGGGGGQDRRCPVAVCHCPTVAQLAAAANSSATLPASPPPLKRAQPPNETAAKCPSCPPPPDCPGSAAAVARHAAAPAASQAKSQQQQQQQEQKQQEQQQNAAAAPSQAAASDEGAGPLLCGGSRQVPPVAQALAAAGEQLQLSLQQHFARYEDKGFTLEDLIQTAENLGIEGVHDTMLWVEVRNGTVVFPRRHGQACTWFCNPELHTLKQGFEAGIRSGQLKVPEGLPPMLWNVYDYSGCDTAEKCPAPLLSVIRHSSHFDVPVPPFNPRFEPHFLPWDEKLDLAFFRGRPWCNNHGLNGTAPLAASNCSREAMPLLSAEHPELLNVTLLDAHGRAPATPGPPTPHAEHARYKHLINLDGITSSRRLATLLAINSLVLKQASAWEEWYYPALHPCVHYLPFWQRSESDILDLLRDLRRPGNARVAQRIAANAWSFAAVHLNEAAVYRRWQAVLDRYAQLYRGAVDPEAAAATLAWAEEVGRRASKLGAEVEARCWQENQPGCWWVGRDAAKEVVRQAQEARQAGRTERSGGGDGTADAARSG